MNLLHRPISALFHQDIILHIQAVYQMASAFNAQSDLGVVLNLFASQQSMRAYNLAEYKYQCYISWVWIVFCKYCSHHIESPYHSISHLL